MDAMQKAAAAARVYQDFAPQTELVVEADCDTLLVYLSADVIFWFYGFEKKQLRVQLTKTRNLIISGEHPIGDNTWRCFRKKFPVSTNCDIGKITAKFENLILYIRLPKLKASADKQDQERPTSTKAPSAEKSDHENPTITKAPKSQKPVNEQKPPNNPSLMTDPAEHINETSNALAKNTESFSGKAKERENEQKISCEKSKELKDSKNMPKITPQTNQKHESDSSNAITKLKMARRNWVLALLLAVVIGLYLQKFTCFLVGKAGN